MPSIFLSHTSIDKPFVEKLAKDLLRLGINTWFDNWNIKIGDSITWKIEDGIRENEYLGIVLSPEALNSEWVKSELGAAWVKQIQTRKVVVLPILYRDCPIPLFLSDRKYADFRKDYDNGLADLAKVFGIKQVDTISEENWRRFTTIKGANWQNYRKKEFEKLVTTLVDRAREYNWSVWVGGTSTPFSLTLSAFIDLNKRKSISIKLIGKTNTYMASGEDEINPNNLKASQFSKYIGNSINECEEYVWRQMDDFKSNYGNPKEAFYYTQRFSRGNEVVTIAKNFVKEFDWYKGDK